jgi:Domain of unknown function (DUF4390)
VKPTSPIPDLTHGHRAQHLRRGFCVAAAALTAGAMLPVQSVRADVDQIEVVRAWLEPLADAEGWTLSADVNLPIPPRLEEALNGGVSLPLVLEFELTRSRWYWFDEKVAQASLPVRLSFQPLTRQYRVSGGAAAAQQFAALEDALKTIGTVRGWRVLEGGQVKAGTVYDAQVRLRLDATQLPKPFQVTALTNREWSLQAEWKRFNFTPEITKNAQ